MGKNIAKKRPYGSGPHYVELFVGHSFGLSPTACQTSLEAAGLPLYLGRRSSSSIMGRAQLREFYPIPYIRRILYHPKQGLM